MKLQILVRLSQRQKAAIVGSGKEIPASPMTFEIAQAHAATIGRMAGKFEVSDSKIYAGFGGFESQLHIPYKMNLGDRIGREISEGTLAEGGNIDHIMNEAKALIDEAEADEA